MEFWEQWKILELGRFVMKLQLGLLPRVSTCTENSYHWSRCQKINVPWELQRTCRNLESAKKLGSLQQNWDWTLTLCMHSDVEKKQCDVTISTFYRSSEKLNWSQHHRSSLCTDEERTAQKMNLKRLVFSLWRNCIVCDQSICWSKNEKDWRFGGSCYTCEHRRQILPILCWESEKIQRGSFWNCSLSRALVFRVSLVNFWEYASPIPHMLVGRREKKTAAGGFRETSIHLSRR